MASKRPGEEENNGHATGDGPNAKKAKSVRAVLAYYRLGRGRPFKPPIFFLCFKNVCFSNVHIVR
jgi:hypothetical protein